MEASDSSLSTLQDMDEASPSSKRICISKSKSKKRKTASKKKKGSKKKGPTIKKDSRTSPTSSSGPSQAISDPPTSSPESSPAISSSPASSTEPSQAFPNLGKGTMTKPPPKPPHIANYVPKNPEMMAFLEDHSRHAVDLLVRAAPRPDYEYLDKSGGLKKGRLNSPSAPMKKATVHPALKRAIDNHGANRRLYRYYEGMADEYCLPIAGMIKHESLAYEDERPCRRLTFKSVFASKYMSAFLTANADIQEDGFHARPAIKLPIPDHIKAILVDDWENVTKNQQLVPLPCAMPVNMILEDYMEYATAKHEVGSAQADILEEVIAGLKEYFDKCLGRILLYRYVHSASIICTTSGRSILPC